MGSLEQALTVAAATKTDEIFVIGGAEIYRLALPQAQRLQLTEIDADFTGDAHFPQVDHNHWHETTRLTHRAEAGWNYAFVTYEKVGSGL